MIDLILLRALRSIIGLPDVVAGPSIMQTPSKRVAS